MKHKLRSYQQVLCVTMEECGELTQACSKYLRFGNTEEIKKEAGDTVHVILDIEHRPLEVPEEIRLCLEQESPEIQRKFATILCSLGSFTQINGWPNM